MNIDKIKRGLHGHILPFKNIPIEDQKKAWFRYRKLVRDLTELVAHKLPGIEKRGFNDHHIDHKISIWYGFKNGIPAEDIAHVDNLRVITAEENWLKGTKCHRSETDKTK